MLCEGYVNILIPRSRGMSRDISRFLGLGLGIKLPKIPKLHSKIPKLLKLLFQTSKTYGRPNRVRKTISVETTQLSIER
jgi:hypothetical protein